jgi:hypothetical protein
MFGLQQAWAPKVKICSDCPSGLKKTQICLDRAISRKQPIFVRTGHLASKTVCISPEWQSDRDKSLGICTVRITGFAQNTYMPSKIYKYMSQYPYSQINTNGRCGKN